jgi:hypothetical protein
MRPVSPFARLSRAGGNGDGRPAMWSASKPGSSPANPTSSSIIQTPWTCLLSSAVSSSRPSRRQPSARRVDGSLLRPRRLMGGPHGGRRAPPRGRSRARPAGQGPSPRGFLVSCGWAAPTAAPVAVTRAFSCASFAAAASAARGALVFCGLSDPAALPASAPVHGRPPAARASLRVRWHRHAEGGPVGGGRPAARAHARRAEAGRATSAALHDQPGGDGAGAG